MKRFFKCLLAIVATLAAGVVIVLYNPNLAKGVLERQISGLTGYPVDLRGDLDITPGRTTVLSARDLRIVAPEWAAVSELATVASVVLKLDTASLFSRAVIVEELSIDELEINLETGASGQRNWRPSQSVAGDHKDGDDRSVVLFSHTRVAAATIRYLNRTRDLRHVLRIASLRQQHLPDGALDITLEGSFNDRPVSFHGNVGVYKNLLLGREIDFEGMGNFGSIDIRTKGFVDDLRNPQEPRFELSMQGPDIDEITAMLGADDLGSGVFTLRALGGMSADEYEAGVNGQVGDVSLNLLLRTASLRNFDDVDLELAASGPNLGAFTRVFGIENWPDKLFRVEASAQRRGNTLNIPTLTLDIGDSRMVLDALLNRFPDLDASRIKLNISGDDLAQFRELLGIRGIVNGPFELKGRLDVSPEEVEVVQVDVVTSLGTMTLSGTLGEAPGYMNSRLHVRLEGHDANQLMKALGVDVLPARPFSLDTRILRTRDGLVFERGALVTVENERFEAEGFVALAPGGNGTDISLKIDGLHLGRALGHVLGGVEFADLPYHLRGRVRLLDGLVRIDDLEAAFADVKLDATGSFSLLRDSPADHLEFEWRGEDFTSIGGLVTPGFSMGAFVQGQSYHLDGSLRNTREGWRLSVVNSRVGDTELDVSGLISNRAKLDGSQVEFSVEGPGLHGLLSGFVSSGSSPGAFESTGRIRLRDGALQFDDVTFEAQGMHAQFDLDVDLPIGRSMDFRFDIDLRGDDLRQLVPANGWFQPAHAAYRLDAAGRRQGQWLSLQHFDARLATLQVSLAGSIGNTSADKSTSILFKAASEDLSALGRTNAFLLPAQPLRLQAELSGNASHFSIGRISGSLGDSDVAGSIGVDLGGTRPAFVVDLQSRLLDLRPFAAVDKLDEPDEPAKPGSHVIPDTPLSLGRLGLADIRFEISVDELVTQRNNAHDIVLTGGTDAGNLRVPEFSWSGSAGGNTKGALSVEPLPGGPARMRLDLDAKGSVFGYFGLTQGQRHKTPAVDIEIHVEGHGNDLRTLAGSMNGEVAVFSAGGTLADVQLSLLDTFFLEEVFKLILAKRDEQEKDLMLSCAAAVFDIRDGVVDTNPAIALTTDKIHLVARGAIDLKKETLKYNFTATPRKLHKVSTTEMLNPYILISGTLADPKVGIDPTRALVHGGAAVGTAGVSILAKAVLDRVGTVAPLCGKMLEQHQGD